MRKHRNPFEEELLSNDFIADVSNSNCDEYYQMYLNGQWIADCADYCEAETIANREAINGTINIERRTD